MARNVTRQDPDLFHQADCQGDLMRYLILHNDNVNTFDHVIQSLIEICDHDPIQAEQCAFITHHTGKCDIRKGSYESLNPLRESLLFRGLQVTID